MTPASISIAVRRARLVHALRGSAHCTNSQDTIMQLLVHLLAHHKRAACRGETIKIRERGETMMNEAATVRPAIGGAAGGSCDGESAFICNICLDITDKEPVVTQCGHLYCWTCLYRWLNTNHTTCPVCKAGITQENVIPLFIRGENNDPRSNSSNVNNNTDNNMDGTLTLLLAHHFLLLRSRMYLLAYPLTHSFIHSYLLAIVADAIPNRPQGRRPEPTVGVPTGNNMNAQFGNMSFSVGFGFFPSLFGLQFQNFTTAPPQTGRPLTPEEVEQQKLSRVLMCVGIIVLSALLFL